MKHTNRQFGEFEYDEKHVVEFPRGIIGFEAYRKFVIVHDEETEPFRWLISLEGEDLSFPIIEPTYLLPYYKSKFEKEDEVSVFLIASLNPKVEESTVNLRSPLVISEKTRVGEQVVLSDDSLSMRYPILSRPNN